MVKQRILIWMIVILLSLIGVYLRNLSIIDIKFTNALEYLIYYHIGYEIQKFQFFNQRLPLWLTAIAIIVFLPIAVSVCVSDDINDFVLKSPLYFIAAITGSYLFLQIIKNFQRKNVISFIGENSLIYLCCHQYSLFIAARGLHISNPFWVTMVALFLSGVVAIVVNRYCPFIIGKRKPIVC
jgi:hypothetical protein